MTATNHALTGAVIGLSVGNPLIALPAALLSHFVCDAIPHFSDPKLKVGSRQFANYLACDALGAVGVALFLTILRPDSWFVACWCAFLATSPDLMWAGRFFRAQKSKKKNADTPLPTHILARFHSRIQWFAKPVGAVVEYAWAIGTVLLLAKLVVI